MLLKSSDLSLAYAYLMVLPARGATTFGCIAGTFYNVFGCGIMPIPNVQFYIRIGGYICDYIYEEFFT